MSAALMTADLRAKAPRKPLSPDEARLVELDARIAEIDAADAELHSRAERRRAAEQTKEAIEDKIRSDKRDALVRLDETSKAAQAAQAAFIGTLPELLSTSEEARYTMIHYQAAVSAARQLGVLAGPPAVYRLGTRARSDRALDKQLVAVRNVLIGL